MEFKGKVRQKIFGADEILSSGKNSLSDNEADALKTSFNSRTVLTIHANDHLGFRKRGIMHIIRFEVFMISP